MYLNWLPGAGVGVRGRGASIFLSATVLRIVLISGGSFQQMSSTNLSISEEIDIGLFRHLECQDPSIIFNFIVRNTWFCK